MNIEDLYRQTYIFEYDDRNTEIECIADMEQELKTGPTYKELAYKLCPKYKDIYLAYTAMVLDKDGMEYVPEQELKINRPVIQSLYRDGYAYEDIINIISTSPLCNSYPEVSPRIAAAGQVVAAVNPIVNIPQLMIASDKKENLSMSKMSTEELYFSILKKEMYRSPNQLLADADKKIVSILLANEYSEDYIREVLRYSPKFNTDFQQLSNDDTERIRQLQEIKDEFNAFMEEAIHSPVPLSTNDELSVHNSKNDFTYEKLMKEIDEIKKRQYSIDLVQFWRQSMDCFQDALSKTHKAKTICQIMVTWSESIEQAAKQINTSVDADVHGISQIAEAYKETAKLESDDWDTIYKMAEGLSNFSNKLLNETVEVTTKNPLLKYPKVYNAVPFEELLRSQSHPAEMIYYSALRKAVLNNPGVGLYEADLKVKEILDMHKKLNDKHKSMIMSYSPRYKHVSKQSQRIAEAAQWLKSIIAKGHNR